MHSNEDPGNKYGKHWVKPRKPGFLTIKLLRAFNMQTHTMTPPDEDLQNFQTFTAWGDTLQNYCSSKQYGKH